MKRPLWLIAGIAGIVILSKVLIENVLGVDLAPLATAWIEHPGAGSAVMVVALLAVDLFLPVPSSVIMVLSGVAFGIFWGSILSFVGSVGGSWIGFELVRRYGGSVSRRIVDDEGLRPLESAFRKYGTAAVIMSRPLPIIMETMSVVAGLSSMKRATFLAASFAGTLPVAIGYAYAGSVSRETGTVLPAFAMFVAVTGVAFLWYRARVSSSRGERATASPNTGS
jgi:uncharacterized membrane protein YdjX (TVP38/TMEM64 family)